MPRPAEQGHEPPPAVLILGMHRSGTSCLTGMLRNSGLYLGDVSTRSRFNAKGNQESFEVREIDEHLLRAAGGSWAEPVPIDPERIGPIPTLRIQRFRILMERVGRPWGFKDPRLLFCLDAWRRPGDRLVGSFRHPVPVVRSLVSRSEARRARVGEDSEELFDALHWPGLWSSYNTELLRRYREEPFPIVCFDWDAPRYRRMVRDLAAALDLPGPDADFFDPDLVHHREMSAEAIEDPDHRRLYEELTIAAEKEEEKLKRRRRERPRPSSELHYRLFDLYVASELELPGLELLGEAHDQASPDVSIELGPVPLQLERPEIQGVCYESEPKTFLLRVEGVGRFLVSEGCRVVIERFEGVEDAELSVFLLEPVLAALLHQRGRLPLRAAALEIGGGSVLLCGAPSSGKSTAARALIGRGYALISDGLCVVHGALGAVEDDAPPAVSSPGLSRQKLWRSAIEELGEPCATLASVRAGLERFWVSAGESFVRERGGHPLRAVFRLVPSNRGCVSVTPLVGLARFEALAQCVFQGQNAPNTALRSSRLRRLAQIASEVPVFRVEWPVKAMRVRELADVLESQILGAGLPPDLESVINTDHAAELRLQRFRRLLLLRRRDTGPAGLGTSEVSWAASLAQQCFNNEYLFAVTAEEEAYVAELEGKVVEILDAGDDPSGELDILLPLVGMYRPVLATAFASRLSEEVVDRLSDPVRTCLGRTWREPLEEERLEKTLRSLGPIGDATSRSIRDQYEESPYPRWFDLPRPERDPKASPRSGRFLRWVRTRRASPSEALEVLVPGCGTGRHPLWLARTHPEVVVTAVDLSRASLAHGLRMASKLGITNVEFVHGDLLEMPRIGVAYDHIDCAGVLHHLEDPERGWSALVDMLRPGGTLRVVVYSSVARLPIAFLRREVGRLGVEPDAAAMKAWRARIMADERYRTLRSAFCGSIDFYTMSSVRDLLFHRREHRYTLTEVETMIERFGLEFLCFRLGSRSMRRRYRERFPDDPKMRSFENWKKSEDLYTGTLAMFDFWLRKPLEGRTAVQEGGTS